MYFCVFQWAPTHYTAIIYPSLSHNKPTPYSTLFPFFSPSSFYAHLLLNQHLFNVYNTWYGECDAHEGNGCV